MIKSLQPEVTKLFQVLRLFKQIEKAPNGSFSSALGLDYNQLQPEQVEFDKQNRVLTIRSLPFPKSTPSLPLSTQLAIVDEATTLALLLTDTRPGVSISLRAVKASSDDQKDDCKFIDVVSKVNKYGRNISFNSAQIFDSASGNLLSDASHVKYMPMPSRISEFMLSEKGWPLTLLYSNHILKDVSNNHETNVSALETMLSNYQYDQEHSTASFESNPQFNNGFGTLHGGAQAILMEHTVRNALKESSSHFQVNSISVEYLSAPKSRSVQIATEPLTDPINHQSFVYSTKVTSKGQENSLGQVGLSIRNHTDWPD